MNLLSRDQTHSFWKTIRFIPKKGPYAAIKGQFARLSWLIWCLFWTYVTVLRLLLPVQSWVSMKTLALLYVSYFLATPYIKSIGAWCLANSDFSALSSTPSIVIFYADCSRSIEFPSCRLYVLYRVIRSVHFCATMKAAPEQKPAPCKRGWPAHKPRKPKLSLEAAST